MKYIKRLFCRHVWYPCISISNEKFQTLGVERRWKMCIKCGKVKKLMDRQYEGGGYK